MNKITVALLAMCWMCVSGRALDSDPAMFLLPSPPLSPAAGDVSPQQKWNQRRSIQSDGLKTGAQKDDADTMDGSETFWSGYRPGYASGYASGYPATGYGGYGYAGAYPSGYAGTGYAGTGYGNPALGVAWSGWGNGQWGHYGSG